MAFRDAVVRDLLRVGDVAGLKIHVRERCREALKLRTFWSLTDWYNGYCPGNSTLRRFRRRRWPTDAPRFTVLIRPGAFTPTDSSFTQTLASVRGQTYPYVQTVRVVDGDAQSALAACRGDFVCFVNVGDELEPHALHRIAAAIALDNADILYSDEVIIDPDGETVLSVLARSAFSYDACLTHAPIGNLLVVRASIVRQRGRIAREGADLEMLLDFLEAADKVSHVPDLLYRRRSPTARMSDALSPALESGASAAGIDAAARLREFLRFPDNVSHAGHEQANVVRRHLERIGWQTASVEPVGGNGCRNVRFPLHVAWRVAIIVPTKNRRELLQPCVASLERTTDPAHVDIFVVDHDSEDPATLEYLRSLPPRHQVLPYSGPFNFSTIMNQATACIAGPYTHYLLLNNDTEALTPGWLEHMMGYALRKDVGIVGVVLLYPNGVVQNAGVQVGAYWSATDAHNGVRAFAVDGTRQPGPNDVLYAAREQLAVTAACLLIRASVFSAVGGFDEQIAVGYGDVDLCLRVRQHGYKVVLDPHAMFLHHESASRGKSTTDPHPADSKRFFAKHRRTILAGDPYYSPLYMRCAPSHWNKFARSNDTVRPRTMIVQRPTRDD